MAASIGLGTMLQKGFPLGMIVATPGAIDTFGWGTILVYLNAHSAGRWGDLCAEDKRMNEEALEHGYRLFSVYDMPEKGKLYIITEHDRSATTILLPEEY